MTKELGLVDRLTHQLAASGVKDAKDEAIAILTKRGHWKDGALTEEGKKREALGAEGRAKDRAVKKYGGKPSDYTYDRKTNYARKK